MAPALFKICAGGSLVMHEMWDTHMTLKSIVKMRMLGKDSVECGLSGIQRMVGL